MTECPVTHAYNPYDPATVRDPYSVLNKLREEGPVFYVPDLNHYVVTRYDGVIQVLLDRETWSASNASSPLLPLCSAAQEVLSKGFMRVPTLNNSDPPRHGPMRKSVLAVFTPRRIKSLEPDLRAYAEQLVLGFRDEPHVNLVERLAFPFPGYAAFTLLGFSPQGTERLKDWSAIRVQLTYGRLSEPEQVAAAGTVVEFWNYCEAHVASRKAQRADDMTSDLLDLADEKPAQLNEFDIVNMVYSMALAGHETTCNAIANGMRNLLADRAQWQRLIDQPELIPNAVEEMLRFEGPLLNHRRNAKVDTEIEGIHLPAGAKVMMSFAAANHDPAVFDEPETFDVTRENAELHLQFGKGPHYCLGAPLGRLEMRIVLELLTTLTPDMELVPDQVFEYHPKATGRNLKQLLVAPRGVR